MVCFNGKQTKILVVSLQIVLDRGVWPEGTKESRMLAEMIALIRRNGGLSNDFSVEMTFEDSK